MIGISSSINAVLKIIAVFGLYIDLETVFYFMQCSKTSNC